MKRFKYLTMAALVAFAACDEADEVIIAPPVTGSISGIVTIDNVGAAGVTVTLSSGTTATTDGSGSFSFSNVTAGAYTVTISGFAADATFPGTAKAATIATAGQVATANFSGSYVRTSAILGSVAAGGSLSGVTVTLSGMSSASTTTDANGQFSFSGLRGGSYTVAMTNPNSAMYSFPTTSTPVTLGVGASEVVTFAGSLLATATVSGRMFLDENDKDNTFSAGLEENLSVANVTVTIEGGAVNNTWTTQTAADGTYGFPDLEAGTYRVTLTTADPSLPGMVTFGGTNPQLVTVTVGATGTVNFPFDISTQTIHIYGMLGTDADVATTPGPGQNPITGWTINLYDTQANAAAGGATGRLGAVATSTSGMSSFRFARTADVSPNSASTDNVVFAQVAGAPTATHAMSGETIIEIKYSQKDSTFMAPDTFDALYNSLSIKVHAAELDADTLAAWSIVMRANKDSTSAVTLTDATDANGDAMFVVTPASLAGMGSTDGAFPDTLWFRLSSTQAGAGGHGFTQAPTAMGGSAAGQYLRYIWNGTDPAGTAVMAGSEIVTYTDVDLVVNGHHERDDSTSIPTYTAGDDLTSVIASVVQIYNDGTNTSAAGPIAGTAAGLYDDGSTVTTVANLDATKDYDIRARSNDANVFVLNDTLIDLSIDGSDQTVTVAPLKGGAGNSAFALKTNNNAVSGTVLADDGTAAAAVIVTLVATPMNIQGSVASATQQMVDTTSAGGAYAFAGIIEGPYTVSVANITGTWEFFDVLTTTTAPNASGSAGNTDANNGDRDVQGYGATSTANFQPDAMDTSIKGVIVNDRDSDFNTLDPDEALSGVTINLIDDADADGAIDTGEATLATTITDVTGAFSFTALREDDYIIQAVSPSNATVLRALSGTGAVTAHIGVTTEAGAGNCVLASCTNQDNTKTVGNTSPPGQLDEFPRWNYLTGAAFADGAALGAGPNSVNGALTTSPTNFVHLFNTGTVTGSVTAGGSAVAGARVTITRCQTAVVAPTPPAIGACLVKHGVPSPHIANLDTDASGNYTFMSLLEGVYQIDVAPQTAGYTNIVTPGAPGSYLATLQGNNDIETVAAFVIS